MGLASPFVVRANILMRNINALKLDWDEAIPEEERKKWIQFFSELFEIQHVKFPRSVRPRNAKDKPLLVIFSDASENAFGACEYLRL